MRIMMASHGYPPTISGVTLIVRKLARAMVARGHSVTVLTASSVRHPYIYEDQGVRLVHLNALSNPFWREGPLPIILLHNLKLLVAKAQPDVLHALETAVLGVQLARVGRAQGRPALASCYYVPRFVTHYLRWNERPLPWIENVTWASTTRVLNLFDHVVFSTQAHRQQYLDHGLATATSVFSNGVNLRQYTPSDGRDPEIRHQYDIPPGLRVLSVGRLARDKQIDVLIRAMAHLWPEMPVHLLVVGRGDEGPKLEALTVHLGLEPCVHFLGYVPEADLPTLYHAAHVFAIASICEVQSLPTLQAAACGLPVVAANALALPELVQHGVNGYLVPPQDPRAMAAAIRKVLRDPGTAKAMGQASLAVAASHDELNTFNQYEALYLGLIQDHSRVNRAAPLPRPQGVPNPETESP